MTTYHLQIQTTDSAWYDMSDAARYQAFTFSRPIEACAEAQQLATSLNAPIRVVETTLSVFETFQPQEKHP